MTEDVIITLEFDDETTFNDVQGRLIATESPSGLKDWEIHLSDNIKEAPNLLGKTAKVYFSDGRVGKGLLTSFNKIEGTDTIINP